MHNEDYNYSMRDLKEVLLRITRLRPDPFEMNDEDDMTVVIDKNNNIRTAWLNRRDDVHRTLDTTKYVQKER